MKISKGLNFFSSKALFAAVGGLFMFKTYKEKSFAKCIPENEDDVNQKEGFNIFDEELSQDDDFMKALQDPSLSEEEKAMLRKQMKQQSIQPFPFSKLHAPFKTGVEEEKWNGLRGVLEWSPNQLAKMEYTLIVDNKRSLNNYKLSAMTLVPFSERSQNGAFLIGRKEGDQSMALQCHLNLSDASKILLVSSHPKPDMNQGHYVFEYSYEFERLVTSLKISNMEAGVSASAALYKNVFLGFEAIKHPKNPSFMYNYGVCLKPSPQNKFGFALSYMSVYPAVSFDFLYQISREWSTYFTLSKNWHPMASMGGNATELKMTHVYNKKDKYEFNFEVDYQGLLHFYHTHYLNKYIGLQLNLEFNPFARWNKKNKKVMRSMGIGFKITTAPIEEEIFNISMEEDFDEYEYDRIATENIK